MKPVHLQLIPATQYRGHLILDLSSGSIYDLPITTPTTARSLARDLDNAARSAPRRPQGLRRAIRDLQAGLEARYLAAQVQPTD